MTGTAGSTWVVLLRAIGPWTHKIMPMSQWRDAALAHGFGDPRTYLASGNMIAEADGDAEAVARRMNALVSGQGLGAANVAVVRTPAQMRALVDADPFPEASKDHPSQMGVYFFAGDDPDFGWVQDYEGHERLRVTQGHLIVDYKGPISGSPKLPGLIEKRSGPVTARNWNTLRGLAERATAREAS